MERERTELNFELTVGRLLSGKFPRCGGVSMSFDIRPGEDVGRELASNGSSV